ncbi:hypothetical protein I4U23_004340 [Adineta vaga]|nr:hypothetical protein I4U23_004340 [Adineta vaga]
MHETFDQIVDAVAIPSSDKLTTIASILDEQTFDTIVSFISTYMESLVRLEHWSWQVLSEDFQHWIHEPSYMKLFHALYTFNIKVISIREIISADTKTRLIIPLDSQWIDRILDQIEANNEQYFKVISLWFDVLSYLVIEQSDIVYLPLIVNLNQRLSRNFIMTEQYKSYLQELSKPLVSQSILTRKLMFYLKTCSLSLNAYFWSKNQDFPFTSQEIVQFLGRDYSEMIRVRSENIDSWSYELLSCIARLTGFICSVCWWGGQRSENIEIIIPSTDTTYTHLLAFIRIVSHQSLQRYITSQWHHDENVLIDTSLILLMAAVETQDLTCFIRSKTNFSTAILSIAQTVVYDRMRVGIYGFLAVILTDTQIKELKIADDMCKFSFDVLENAWKHPKKKWKKIPILYLLKGFLSLSTNDTIQKATVELQKLPMLIELCDEYPIVYEIIWSLTFHPSIQEQLRSNQPFMVKLTKLEGEIVKNASIAKSVNGILWILNSNYDNINDNQLKNAKMKFDLMISYSHKEKDISKQLYEELIRAGYRVWIDFDQMRGNVMDAMAQAIEQAHTVIICMSNQYQRSSYCRAEAQYAFKCQRKIVPILVQQYYKPDGWLAFLLGQILYIDFTKHEFQQAIKMLLKQLELTVPQRSPPVIVDNKSIDSSIDHLVKSSSVLTPSSAESIVLPENVRDWTCSHVQQWLKNNNLPQMAKILSDTDGQSLIYLTDYMINDDSNKMLTSLQQDSLRRTNEPLSLIEMARFRSLIEKEGFEKLKPTKPTTATMETSRSKSCQIL